MNNFQTVECIQNDESSSCDDPEVLQNEAIDVKGTAPENSLKGFSCTFCNHITSSSQRLKEHLSSHSGIKHLECNICGKKFAWRYSFKNHMVSHMENNPNKCTICGKKYCNKSSLKNHMLRIHGNPTKNFKCEKCDKGYFTKSELDRHSFKHSNEKPYVCEFCGNSYRFKGALSVHYRVHSGEKPYKCEYCDKTFIHLSSIIGHRRRHTGEKPFQCKECGKSFSVKRAMSSHMSVHNKEGKFKCGECRKTFKSRSGYRVHLDFHLGIKRHACKYCEKSFRAWSNMHKHMKRHLSERFLKCKQCDKTFIDKQDLKIHTITHNEIENTHKQDKIPFTHIIMNSDIPATTLANSSCNIEPSIFENSDMIPHINMTESEEIFDCTLSNALDKCQVDKCQLMQDNYVSQLLYSQPSPMQYVPQPMPVQNMYPSESEQISQRSACLSNMNSVNFCCVQLNNQNFNSFPYNLPNSEEILSKCKLCRSLFHSSLVLRSHLLDYHRIDEENVDQLLT